MRIEKTFLKNLSLETGEAKTASFFSNTVPFECAKIELTLQEVVRFSATLAKDSYPAFTF